MGRGYGRGSRGGGGGSERGGARHQRGRGETRGGERRVGDRCIAILNNRNNYNI